MADKMKERTAREDRLSSALRDNLKKRKDQARQRVGETEGGLTSKPAATARRVVSKANPDREN